MENILHEIKFRDLKKYFPSLPGDNLSDDFLITELKDGNHPSILLNPCRIDGYLIIFCLEGNLKAEINLKTYDIHKNTVVINVPGNIGHIKEIPRGGNENLHIIAIAISSDFLSGSRMDYMKLFEKSISVLDNPCFKITDDQKLILDKYFELINAIIKCNSPGRKDMLQGILSSCLYYAGSIWQERLSNAESTAYSKTQGVRSKFIFEQFLKLVGEHHGKERGMAFYADKLCLSPKYLSKVVKNVSGKSGPEWIDSYVILEAKNMLKYSDMPLKEIVYRLNFPNSSVFYKFFKSHTGQTPSEYRK